MAVISSQERKTANLAGGRVGGFQKHNILGEREIVDAGGIIALQLSVDYSTLHSNLHS